MGCPCRSCDKAFPARFVAYYGYAPDNPPTQRRRTHDEVVTALRERAELRIKKREGRARFYGKGAL